MSLKHICLYFLLCCVLPSKAQDADFTLLLRDKENGQPVSSATVCVLSADGNKVLHTAVSNTLGVVQLPVDSFPAKLAITATGFAPLILPVKKEAGRNITLQLEKSFSKLDEVVITGLSDPIKLRNALSTYQVIGKEQMDAQGAVTVADALKNQINLNIAQDNLLGSSINMQGMQGDKVKILVDGMPVNGREGGKIDLGQLNLYNVERIEIVQGPMSVVYGTDALGGVINIITKKPKAPWQFSAGTYYETVGKYNFDISGSYRIGKAHQFSLGGGRNFFGGWNPLDSLERSYLWKPKEQYLANFAYSFHSKKDLFIDFNSDFVKEKVTNKDAYYSVNAFAANARDEYYHTTRSLNRLSLKGKIGKNGQWQSMNSFALYRRIRNTYIKDLFTMNQDLSDVAGAQDTTQFNDFSFRGSYAHQLRSVDLTAGYDINLEHGESQKIDTTTKNINDFALYLSASLHLAKDKLVLQPALRMAYNNVYQPPLVPSFNALFHASDRLQFRFSFAKGYRAPSLKEMYLHFYDANHEVEGNPNLEPEHGSHVQLSGSWTLHQKAADYIKVLLTGYYNDVYNQITLIQPDPSRILYATYINVNHTTNAIGSLQADAQLGNFYTQLGYSVLHLMHTDSALLTTSHQATATLRYQFVKAGISISSFYKYFSRQPNLVPTVDGGAAYSGTVDPYSFWDASVEKKFWKNRLQLIVGVKNILDVRSSRVVGAQAVGVHSGGGDLNAQNISMGRSMFTTLRLSLQ